MCCSLFPGSKGRKRNRAYVMYTLKILSGQTSVYFGAGGIATLKLGKSSDGGQLRSFFCIIQRFSQPMYILIHQVTE